VIVVPRELFRGRGSRGVEDVSKNDPFPVRMEPPCPAVIHRHGARLPERVTIILEGKPPPDKSAVDISQQRTDRGYM